MDIKKDISSLTFGDVVGNLFTFGLWFYLATIINPSSYGEIFYIVERFGDDARELDYNEARKLVYGMPYEEWKKKYQIEQTKERLKKVESKFPNISTKKIPKIPDITGVLNQSIFNPFDFLYK